MEEIPICQWPSSVFWHAQCVDASVAHCNVQCAFSCVAVQYCIMNVMAVKTREKIKYEKKELIRANNERTNTHTSDGLNS